MTTGLFGVGLFLYRLRSQSKTKRVREQERFFFRSHPDTRFQYHSAAVAVRYGTTLLLEHSCSFTHQTFSRISAGVVVATGFAFAGVSIT